MLTKLSDFEESNIILDGTVFLKVMDVMYGRLNNAGNSLYFKHIKFLWYYNSALLECYGCQMDVGNWCQQCSVSPKIGCV